MLKSLAGEYRNASPACAAPSTSSVPLPPCRLRYGDGNVEVRPVWGNGRAYRGSSAERRRPESSAYKADETKRVSSKL